MKMLKQHSDTTGLAALRKRLGLNQEQLALLLKVHRSTIKFVEQGKRSLPMASLLLLANMEIQLAKTPDQVYTNTHPGEHQCLKTFPQHHDQLFERGSICRFNRHKLQKQLTMKISLYQRTRERLHIIETAMQEDPLDLQTVQCWKRLQETAIQAFDTCGLAVQELLRCRIAILDAEAALYQHMKLRQKKKLPHYFFEPHKEC